MVHFPLATAPEAELVSDMEKVSLGGAVRGTSR